MKIYIYNIYNIYNSNMKINKKLYIYICIIILLICLILYNIKNETFTDTINTAIYTPIHTTINTTINTSPYVLPKIIWMFWNTTILPERIELILNNNKNILGNDWTINVLNDENLAHYLDIETFPKNYSTLQVQHKADFIRLKILEKNGGIWLDASIVINSKDSFEKLYNDNITNQYEISLFTLDDKEEEYKYHQYTENWFIIAPVNSKIIKLWLEEFTNAINMGFLEYKKNIQEKLNVKLCYRLNNSNYLIQHSALQTVFQKRIDWEPKILFLRSEETMFKILKGCNFNNTCVKNEIETNKDNKNIPYIKVTQSGSGIDWKKYFS
jgi:hypothetical protein